MLPPKAPSNGGESNKNKDYLRERRYKREREQLLKEQQEAQYDKESWAKVLEDKNLSKKQKVEKVKVKAKELEEKALQKEKNSALKSESSFYGAASSTNMGTTTRGTTVVNRGASVEDTLEVNDMLIDAIKAKLAILDTLE